MTAADRESKALANHARQLATIIREEEPGAANEPISFVLVVGPDGKVLVHPYAGDALFELVTSAGAPMHASTDRL